MTADGPALAAPVATPVTILPTTAFKSPLPTDYTFPGLSLTNGDVIAFAASGILATTTIQTVSMYFYVNNINVAQCDITTSALGDTGSFDFSGAFTVRNAGNNGNIKSKSDLVFNALADQSTTTATGVNFLLDLPWDIRVSTTGGVGTFTLTCQACTLSKVF